MIITNFENNFCKRSNEGPDLESIKLPYSKDTKNIWEKQLNAQLQLFYIALYYNEGWVPDFTNSDYKYTIRKYWSVSGWVIIDYCCFSTASRPSGVCFKSSEIVNKVIEKYSDIINDYFMI